MAKFDKDNKAHFDMKCFVLDHGWPEAVDSLAAVMDGMAYSDQGAEQRRQMLVAKLTALSADIKKWMDG